MSARQVANRLPGERHCGDPQCPTTEGLVRDLFAACLANDRQRVADEDGRSFHNTEFLTFAGGKVRRIDVYFGAARQDGRFLPQPR